MIYKDCAELYNLLRTDIEENPEVHYNKKYKVGLSYLHELLEKAQDEFTFVNNQQPSKKNSLFNKIPQNIPGVNKLKEFMNVGDSAEDKLDEYLGKAAIQATQLRSCTNCACLHCTEDNCRASCFICHAQSHVIYCDRICIRKCNNWNIAIQGARYSVKFMSTIIANEHNYLFICKDGDTNLKPMVFNFREGTVKYPQDEHMDELQQCINIIKELLISAKE